jgi:hypothetical protein
LGLGRGAKCGSIRAFVSILTGRDRSSRLILERLLVTIGYRHAVWRDTVTGPEFITTSLQPVADCAFA